MYLTKSEQRLYDKLPESSFSVNDIARLGLKRKYLVELLDQLAGKRLLRVKKGVYLNKSLNEPLARYHIGLAFAGEGYIAFSSALSFYGLLDEMLSKVFVATREKRNKKIILGMEYELVPLTEDFYGVRTVRGIRVSSLAKTFFDCLKKPILAGGPDKILECFDRSNFSKADWRELLYYLTETKSTSLKQRAGFLLESRAPEYFSKKLLTAIKRKNVVFMAKNSKGAYNKKWGVYHDG